MTEMSMKQVIEPKVMGVIGMELLQSYSIASGDYNKIHLDETIAKAAGLPGVIAHGMLMSGWMHTRVLQALVEVPDFKNFTLESTQTRFRAMTLVGDEVSVSGHWQIESSENIKLDLVAKNQKNETLITGVFKLVK